VCVSTQYIYIDVICVHMTCTVPVIGVCLFQDKKENIKPVLLFVFYMKLKVLLVLLD